MTAALTDGLRLPCVRAKAAYGAQRTARRLEQNRLGPAPVLGRAGPGSEVRDWRGSSPGGSPAWVRRETAADCRKAWCPQHHRGRPGDSGGRAGGSWESSALPPSRQGRPRPRLPKARVPGQVVPLVPAPCRPWNSVRKVEPCPGLTHTPRAVGRASPGPRDQGSVCHLFLRCHRPWKEPLSVHPSSAGWPFLTSPGMGLGTQRIELKAEPRAPPSDPCSSLAPPPPPALSQARAGHLLLGGPGPSVTSHSQPDRRRGLRRGGTSLCGTSATACLSLPPR